MLTYTKQIADALGIDEEKAQALFDVIWDIIDDEFKDHMRSSHE